MDTHRYSLEHQHTPFNKINGGLAEGNLTHASFISLPSTEGAELPPALEALLLTFKDSAGTHHVHAVELPNANHDPVVAQKLPLDRFGLSSPHAEPGGDAFNGFAEWLVLEADNNPGVRHLGLVFAYQNNRGVGLSQWLYEHETRTFTHDAHRTSDRGNGDIQRLKGRDLVDFSGSYGSPAQLIVQPYSVRPRFEFLESTHALGQRPRLSVPTDPFADRSFEDSILEACHPIGPETDPFWNFEMDGTGLHLKQRYCYPDESVVAHFSSSLGLPKSMVKNGPTQINTGVAFLFMDSLRVHAYDEGPPFKFPLAGSIDLDLRDIRKTQVWAAADGTFVTVDHKGIHQIHIQGGQ